ENVHAIFVLTATAWLLITTTMGLLLVLNFTRSLLPADSLNYLSLHAHLGIVGWFLLLVMGVGSRLLPMFLISKYDDPKRLWRIYYCINGALLLFVVVFFSSASPLLYALPLLLLLTGLLLFGGYCRKAYRQRIRKQVDEPVKISLLSIAMLALPVLLLVVLIGFLLTGAAHTRWALAYGFSVFFGWLTAIMLGMTFKTLPFIVWNKVYHDKAHLGKTPNPKDLFNSRVFNCMAVVYLSGFGLFTAGIIFVSSYLLQLATVLLLVAAILYNFNTVKVLRHKPLVQ
ncbi:MAG TPA: cytochrome C oxidase subunit I, partial [Flavisolibacter sp.]|nr:cytochrome C oxidase subunit I [Flavisolibacter sp.]